MGRDKAMLELGGKTLLARAVDTLRTVGALGSRERPVEVTVCGAREQLEGADRAIVDRYPGCGPLGGIEAALDDLILLDTADWAFFIPVDMPLLSGALIDDLLQRWMVATQEEGPIRACMVEVEGRAQPLVSLVHRSVHALVQSALQAEDYKVVPVLHSAMAYCMGLDQCGHSTDGKTANGTILGAHVALGKRARSSDGAGGATRDDHRLEETLEQFSNVNTEADLLRVATLLQRKGSN